MNKRQLSFLTELLSQPTAPFRERHIIDFAVNALTDAGVPYFQDPVGNLIVGCESPARYQKILSARTREPLRVYIAHMDHPGFHGVRWLNDRRLLVQWHGGGPTRHLANAPVWLATDDGMTQAGTMQRARVAPHGHSIATAEIKLARPFSTRPDARRVYGGFAFRAPVWRQGSKLYTKAADDLVGVFAVLATAISERRRASTNFIGLLTRAEEVGFVGAIGHFNLGWLTRARRNVVCISLETSRTLPGAIIGKGPVVRLGDRRTVFQPDALNVLTQVAQRALPKRHQRRVMDGGTCEATAATVYGLKAIGISIPLGNYHNQSLEGGPDARGPNGPAPEFVHLDDIDGMLTLCRELLTARLPWADSWHVEKRTYRERLKKFRALLA